MSESKDDLLERAKKHFKLAAEAWAKQRDREKEDLAFQVPENQWTAQARKERQGRPTLSISRIEQPQQLILNQMRSAQLGVNISPVSEDADQDTAEMLQGMYRHIERTSRAELARFWAFQRAVAAGMGAYLINTEYDSEGGSPGDQKIVIKRILHQDGVYFDPTASEPDFSDGKFAFLLAWLTRDDFKKQFPKAKQAWADDTEWADVAMDAPEWIRDEDVLVATYYWVENNGEGKEPTIHVDKLCGWEVLEEDTFIGCYIPAVPVIGRELQPVDGERHWEGMIRPVKDGQALYNYAASSLVESMSAEPKAPYILDPRQIEGYEEWWQNANTRNYPYLPVKAVMEGGSLLPPPTRAQVDTSRMQLSLMALQQADQFIMATTSTFEASQGRLPEKERSGKAILALQQQSDASTSHFLQNLADISMAYEAKIILDLIPKVYDRPGRITRILRGDDQKTDTVMLNKPYVMDPQTKRPTPFDPNSQGGAPAVPMPGSPQPTPQAPQPKPKHYDLTKGRYACAVTVGKSYQSRLEQGATEMGQVLQSRPELMPMIGDLYFRFRDFPGAKEIADRLAKIREKTMPGLGEGDEPNPEEAAAKVQALEQQLQVIQAQMQAMAKALETEQIKHEAALKKAEMDNSARVQISERDNQTKLAIAEMQARMDLLLEEIKAANAERQMQHSEREAEAGREHEGRMAMAGQEHEGRMERMGQEHEGEMAERAHEGDMAGKVVESMLTPPPARDMPMEAE